MTERLKARLQDMQARIAELERRLAVSRRTADEYRLWVRQLRSSRSWRVVAVLRKLLAWTRRGGSAELALPVDQAVQDRLPRIGPVAELLAALPAEALAHCPPGVADTDLRLVDLAKTMASVMNHGTPAAPAVAATLAVLGGDALLCELAFDAAVVPVRETAWREQLTAGRFAFVLLETAWPERTEVERMLGHCRSIGLPTVFWFRESAEHYPRLAWLAGHVDIVYVAEQSMLSCFAADYPQSRSAWLPPAVQPALCNPLLPPALIRTAQATRRRVLLDASVFPATAAMDMPSVRALEDALMVVDGAGMGTMAQGHLLGRLDPLDRIAIRRLVGAELFLDGPPGTEPDAAGRQLRAAASGAVPIGPALSTETWADAARTLLADPLQRARVAHLGFRTVFSSHCVADRLQRMADDLQLPVQFVPPPPRIACLLVTRRAELLPACIDRFRRDVYPARELIVVVHGDPLPPRLADSLAGPGEAIRIFSMDSGQTLGACLNFAFAQTGAEYWCKWDDDDFYGPHYLSDFMLYRRAIDFDLAGKPMVFTLLDEANELRWDPKWAARANLLRTCTDTRNTGVAGATLFGHRRVLEATPFPDRRERGTDTEFLLRCHAQGWSLLSTDPFNFVRYRSARQGFHTWQLPDGGIRGRTLCIGGRADIPGKAFI